MILVFDSKEILLSLTAITSLGQEELQPRRREDIVWGDLEALGSTQLHMWRGFVCVLGVTCIHMDSFMSSPTKMEPGQKDRALCL